MERFAQRPLAPIRESAEVHVLEDEAGREGADDRREPDAVGEPREPEAAGEPEGQEYVARAEERAEAEQAWRQPQPDDHGTGEEQRRLGDDPGDRSVREGRAAGGGADRSGDHRKDHQPQDVVHHRGPQDDARLPRLRAAEILQHPGGDPDARGAQRRAQEGVQERSCVRQEPRPDQPAEQERCRDPERCDQERRHADPHHLPDGRFEADVEEKDEHAEARQQIDVAVAGDRVEAVEPQETEVPEDHPGQQLPQDRRLPQPRRHVAAELGGDQDDGDQQDDGCYRVRVHAATLPRPDLLRVMPESASGSRRDYAFAPNRGAHRPGRRHGVEPAAGARRLRRRAASRRTGREFRGRRRRPKDL
jgi:hypothetical protein